MTEKKRSVKKLIVLLLVVFFLFGCSNRSDITKSYDNCWTDCKKDFSDDFCKKACKRDLRWKYFATARDKGVWFYDTDSVTYTSESVTYTLGSVTTSKPPEKRAKVWFKIIPTEKGREELVKEFGEKYKKADFILNLSEISCTQREIHRLEWRIYSSDGEIIEEGRDISSWEPITPGSTFEVLFNEVCSKKNK